MSNYKIQNKITGHILFVIIFLFFSTLQAKNLDKYNEGRNVADYFSGILLLNKSKYVESYNYLKKLEGLERSHSTFQSKYLYSLVNSGYFNKAFNYSKKMEDEQQDIFENDLVIGVYYLKNSKFELSKKYFSKAKKRKSRSVLDNFMVDTLYVWSDLKNNDLDKAKLKLSQLDDRFKNIKKIQNVFLNCFYNKKNTSASFQDLTSDIETDFSRYNYFHAKYLNSIGEKDKALIIIKSSLEKNPRNLLLNQLKIDLEKSKNQNDFDCRKEKDVIAELLFIAANALSAQSMYPLSNFYLNLSKYLNKNFHGYDTLLAENFYNINDYLNAKKIYGKLLRKGIAFNWYSNKQISRILIEQEKKEEALKLLKNSFNSLPNKDIYEIYDYAEFLKNNEEFKESIKYYTEIKNQIDRSHPLYPEVTDSRGVAYERIDEWKKAEKDLLDSLSVNPNQAYVINYLAYSWIEQGKKIERSLKMLEKANKLKSNDPYIIDSLGWALFKLQRYKESKEYLQTAVQLMPSDPIVNDHYGDVLWKNGNRIQARYYWNYVLNLEKAEKDLKTKVEQKLLKGL